MVQSVSHQEGNRNAHSCPDPKSESGLLPGCYMLTKRCWKSKGRKQNPIEKVQPSCKLGAWGFRSSSNLHASGKWTEYSQEKQVKYPWEIKKGWRKDPLTIASKPLSHDATHANPNPNPNPLKPGFNPQGPHGERRKPTSTSCPLATCHTHIANKQIEM